MSGVWPHLLTLAAPQRPQRLHMGMKDVNRNKTNFTCKHSKPEDPLAAHLPSRSTSCRDLSVAFRWCSFPPPEGQNVFPEESAPYWSPQAPVQQEWHTIIKQQSGSQIEGQGKPRMLKNLIRGMWFLAIQLFLSDLTPCAGFLVNNQKGSGQFTGKLLGTKQCVVIIIHWLSGKPFLRDNSECCWSVTECFRLFPCWIFHKPIAHLIFSFSTIKISPPLLFCYLQVWNAPLCLKPPGCGREDKVSWAHPDQSTARWSPTQIP